MTYILIVGAGGFLGAISRYGLSTWIHQKYEGGFPLGTLIVNVLGCLLLGGLMYLSESRETFNPNIRFFVGIGILGAFTTFSTFGFETFALLRTGGYGAAGLYIAGNLVLGLAAVWGGHAGLRAVTA